MLFWKSKMQFKINSKLNFVVLNTFQKSCKVFIHSFVCLSAHALILANIFQMSWNLNILFIPDIAWILLKMVHIGLMVGLQKRTDVIPYIKAYGGYNEITDAIQIHKSIFPVKNGINSWNILHRGSHKSVPIHNGLWRKNFKAYFNTFILIK